LPTWCPLTTPLGMKPSEVLSLLKFLQTDFPVSLQVIVGSAGSGGKSGGSGTPGLGGGDTPGPGMGMPNGVMEDEKEKTPGPGSAGE
jgi:hypothetical protein